MLDFLIATIDWDDVGDIADDLLDKKLEKSDVVDKIVEVLDAAFDAHSLLPGPAGIVVEALDGPAIRGFIGIVVSLRVDPVRRDARRAKRVERRKARQDRRAARKES